MPSRGAGGPNAPEAKASEAAIVGTARRRIAAGLGQALYRSGLHKLAWRNHAVIVLFHRVDDRYMEDPITCSRALFRAFCDFFARYFTVVSLSELLDRLRRGADISRRLVITFDDGYRDNYAMATEELQKRGLPACFFVATGFIGTARSAWWDDRQSISSEWMSWDEVRSLHERGFEVGAHTITHIDCGQASAAEAKHEIAGSKEQLEQRIGAAVRHFAYPFGGPDHLSESNRAIVRQSGFSCCVSAHGGLVHALDDPFRLQRVPLNAWYLSPYQFGFETFRELLRRH